MLKLSIIHYLALSLATCPSPKSILKWLTPCPGFVDFCREKVATGGTGSLRMPLQHTWQTRTKTSSPDSEEWFM